MQQGMAWTPRGQDGGGALQTWVARWGLVMLVASALACGPLAPRQVPPAAVKLGVVAPFSGVHQHAGERVLRAVKLAVAERNARGGPGGRPVEVVAHDDRSELSQGAVAARRLAIDPEVVGVLGHIARPSAEAALPVYHEARLPAVVLGSVAGARPDSGGLVLHLAPSTAHVAKAAAEFALRQQARTAAVVAGPLSQDLALAEALRQAAQTAGLKLLRSEALFPASTDYRETVKRLSAAAPDVVFIAAALPTSAAFWREAGGSVRFGVLVGGMDMAPQDFHAVAGPASRNAFFPAPAPSLSANPALAAFAERYRQQWGRDPDAGAALAFDAAGLLLEAMDRAASRQGNVTREAVTASLSELRGYGGVTGRAVFDASGLLADPSLFFVSATGGEPSGGRSGSASLPLTVPAR